MFVGVVVVVDELVWTEVPKKVLVTDWIIAEGSRRLDDPPRRFGRRKSRTKASMLQPAVRSAAQVRQRAVSFEMVRFSFRMRRSKLVLFIGPARGQGEIQYQPPGASTALTIGWRDRPSRWSKAVR